MLINNIHLAELESPNQTIRARVELYKGSALEKICNCGDLLSDFTVEKTGEGKFFGFGICQKLSTNLIDIERELNITKDHTIEASFGVDSDYIYPFPNFYIYDVNRDETSNLITVTAYDALYEATNHTVEELELPASYSIRTFAAACARLLNIPLVIDGAANAAFDLMYETGANFDGSESIRSALNRIAEATQTIYYMDSNWDLYFKRLDKDGAPVVTIGKSNYINFQNEGELVLKNITHTTELGDSVSTVTSESDIEEGITQFIRDNPFLELREDIGALLDAAQAIAGGTIIAQFECDWLGNYLLEIGDKIALEAEDGALVASYVMDDTVIFDGTLSQFTKWAYDDNSAETTNNPTTLGEALNKTFARVDKVNQRIDFVVKSTNANTDAISALQINADSIGGSVKRIQESTSKQIEDLNNEITTTKEELAEFKVSADKALLTFETTIEENGVTKVDTGTGFRFDADGLNISKPNSEISTTISEDGMAVSRNNENVLVANNAGVNALNLHATTYLIIGNSSRLEDWNGRTACFWIGG